MNVLFRLETDSLLLPEERNRACAITPLHRASAERTSSSAWITLVWLGAHLMVLFGRPYIVQFKTAAQTWLAAPEETIQLHLNQPPQVG